MDVSAVTKNHPRIKRLVEELVPIIEAELSAITDLAQAGEDGLFRQNVAVATYDFAIHGGSTAAAIDLGVDLPANAFVTKVSWHEVTALDSANDTVTATLKAGTTALTSAVGVGDGDGTEGTVGPVYLSAASELKLTLGVQAATAGKIKFFVEYGISEAEA